MSGFIPTDSTFLIALTSAFVTFAVILAVALSLLKRTEKKKDGVSEQQRIRLPRFIQLFWKPEILLLVLLVIAVVLSSQFRYFDTKIVRMPQGKTVEGQSVSVIDGDGLEIDGQQIRIWGIDAPETEQPCTRDGRSYACGREATALMRELVREGDIRCEEKDRDRYGRIVARCFAGETDLAAEMVRQGYALDWRRYSGGFYAQQQREARQNSRGMWAGEFEKPWEWRWSRQ